MCAPGSLVFCQASDWGRTLLGPPRPMWCLTSLDAAPLLCPHTFLSGASEGSPSLGWRVGQELLYWALLPPPD